MYILSKMSYRDWELRSEHIQPIRLMLQQYTCDSCQWTREEYLEYIERFPNEQDEFSKEALAKGYNPNSYTDFFPENYADLPDAEKIALLLSTACGCEFFFEIKENN